MTIYATQTPPSQTNPLRMSNALHIHAIELRGPGNLAEKLAIRLVDAQHALQSFTDPANRALSNGMKREPLSHYVATLAKIERTVEAIQQNDSTRETFKDHMPELEQLQANATAEKTRVLGAIRDKNPALAEEIEGNVNKAMDKAFSPKSLQALGSHVARVDTASRSGPLTGTVHR